MTVEVTKATVERIRRELRVGTIGMALVVAGVFVQGLQTRSLSHDLCETVQDRQVQNVASLKDSITERRIIAEQTPTSPFRAYMFKVRIPELRAQLHHRLVNPPPDC